MIRYLSLAEVLDLHDPIISGRRVDHRPVPALHHPISERMRSISKFPDPDSESLYARPEAPERPRESARRDRAWEVGATPLPSSIETDPEPRGLVDLLVPPLRPPCPRFPEGHGPGWTLHHPLVREGPRNPPAHAARGPRQGMAGGSAVCVSDPFGPEHPGGRRP